MLQGIIGMWYSINEDQPDSVGKNFFMEQDLLSLYSKMLKSRLFEEAVNQLWEAGLISGEMHLGTGEEAIVAGVLDHLRDGDAMALDHRATPPLIMRGVDPVLILRELLGQEAGLCAGQGGHMHLYAEEYLAASSGIVGAAGPAAAGFALAAKYLHPGCISVAFFGEGAMNQGMLMESMNLAAVWNLPVLFICKDDGWSITSKSTTLTAGQLSERARCLGLTALEADGRDVLDVWKAAKFAIDQLRLDKGPHFLRLRCIHLEGHFLGYQMLRVIRNPIKELPGIVLPLIQSLFKRGGASFRKRLMGLNIVNSAMGDTWRDPRRKPTNDPILRARRYLHLDPEQLAALEADIQEEIHQVVKRTLQEENA